MIGTRRFTDNKGNNYFVGIGAVDPGYGVQANAKRMIAETLARKNVAMALIGDLVAQREMKQNLKVFADQTTATKQKIVDTISSKVDLHLKGCMSLAKKEVKHPITGKRIYVSAYYIDPAMAKEAGDTMKKMFADAGLVAQHTNKQRGVVEGATRAYGAAKNDPSARAAGAAEGAAAVNAKIQAEKRAAAEKAARAEAERNAKARAASLKAAQAQAAAREAANKAAAENRAAAEKASAVSKGGTHSGGTIDTDF
jgi:colicin import membrane protein